MIRLQCEKCSEPLQRHEGMLNCEGCRSSFPLVDGLPSFAKRADYFFGEIAADRMRSLATEIERDGWECAFERVLTEVDDDLAEYIWQYIGDSSRAAWKYLLPLPENGVALDLGCGWGETSLSLAESVGHVVSMDLTCERLLLLHARAQAMGIKNIEPIHGGDVIPLPFAPNTFDLVVLNGVLEWVPVTAAGSPRDAQLAVLRDLARVLKPNGVVYIGIENRYGYRYFLGRREEHVKVKYISLLPRVIANWWNRRINGEDYRTHTHSLRAWRRLLDSAGLFNKEFYCPWPDYREFNGIAALSRRGSMQELIAPRKAFKRAIVNVLERMGILQHIVPSFGIVASTSPLGVPRIAEIMKSADRQLGIESDTSAAIHVGHAGKMLVFPRVRKGDPREIVVCIPTTETAKTARKDGATIRSVIRSNWKGDKKVVDVIPRVLTVGNLGRDMYVIEERKHGIRGSDLPNTLNGQDVCDLGCKQVSEWVVAVQQGHGGIQRTWTTEDLVHVVRESLNEVSKLKGQISVGESDRGDMLDTLRRIAEESVVPVVVSHGDLHLGNALFTLNPLHLTGVIDWDLATTDGIPVTDVLYMLMMRRMELHGESYSTAVGSLASDVAQDERDETILCGYEQSFEMGAHFRLFALASVVFANIRAVACRRPRAFRKLAVEADLAIRILERRLAERASTGPASIVVDSVDLKR